MLNSVEKIIQFFCAEKKRFLFFTLLFSAIIHAPFFDSPPRGTHVWRQCNTLAVARNFYEEDMNILKPRVDRRGNSDGVTGMQFPSYEFIVACFYKIFGLHDSISRIISFLIFCFGVWMIYELFLQLFSSVFAASVAAWSYCWSPELFYHGINAMPDVLALTTSLAGFLFFLRWRATRTTFLIPVFAFFLALAGLTKIQFLAIGFPIFALFIKDLIAKKYERKELTMLVTAGIFSTAIPVLWYLHALQMIEQSGLRDFGISFSPAKDADTALKILKNNILIDVPETLLNYAGTIFMLTGIYFFVHEKKWKSNWFSPLLVWSVALATYHIIELNQMEFHNYYSMPHIPLLLIPVVCGAIYLWKKKWFALLLLLFTAQPILAALRIIPARWSENKISVPLELYNSESRKKLADAVPNNKLCLVGSDKSGCIYFYFLHKKGFGFDTPEDLLKKNEDNVAMIENCINKGTQYLYTNEEVVYKNRELQKYFAKIILQEGSFKVIELKMAE